MNYRFTICFLIILFSTSLILLIGISGTNIHGDGSLHASLVSEIIMQQDFIDQHPFRLISGNDINVRYPIHYPYNFYSLATVTAIFTGIPFLKYFNLFLVIVGALLVYAIFNKNLALVAITSIPFLLFFTSRRIIMSPLIEPLLLVYSMFFIYSMYNYEKNKNKKFLFLAGIALGALVSTKQQGLIYFSAMFVGIFLYTSIELFKKRKNKGYLLFLPFLIATLLFSPFLIDQHIRTGTIFYAPGEVIEVTSLFNSKNFITDLFTSNIPIDENAIEEIEKIVSYRPKVNFNLIGSLKQFLLYPFLNFRAGDIIYQNIYGLKFLVASSFIYLSGLLLLYKRSQILFFLFSVILTVELFLIFFLNHYLYQYYIFSLAILAIILSMGIVNIFKVMSFRGYKFIFAIAPLILALLFSISAYTENVIPTIGSGRQETHLLDGYEDMSFFIRENIGEEEIIISSGTYSNLYRRYSLWLNEGGGSEIPLIFGAKNASNARDLMLKNNANYLLFDTSQLERRGTIDSIDSRGLVSIIGDSREFTLMKKVNSGKDSIYLYQLSNETRS